MGASVRPEDPTLKLRYFRETGQEREAQLYERYLRDTGQLVASPRAELADTAAGGAIEEETEPGYGGRLVRTVLNAASAVPGVEAVMAGAGALGSKLTDNPLSYEESLETLREETGKIPKGRRIAGKIVGGVAGGLAALPLLPASPVAAGATYAAAEQALSADPVKSLDDVVMRAGKTAGAAAVGAAGGKVGELGAAGVRALKSKGTEALLKATKEEGGKIVSPLYDKAIQEGAGKSSSAVKAFLLKPKIAARVEKLLEREDLAGLAPDDPKVLDQLYKDLSDDVGSIQRGLEMPTVAKGNTRRSALKDIRQLQKDFLDVVSGGQSLPGPMPTYRAAVGTAAERKGLEEAVRKGHNAVWSAGNRNLKSARVLEKRGPLSLEEYIAAASPAEREMASKGVIGASREGFGPGKSLRKTGLPALSNQSRLLRTTGDARQRTLDDLIRGGLFLGEGVPLEELLRR